MALTDKLSAIADAIRAKTGKTDGLTLEQMPTEIASIETGGGSAEGCVTVTFMNGDTELFSRPVYIGDDCPDPIAQGRLDTPTKESTAQYNYVFYGWGASDGGAADGDILKNITEDKTVYAVYTAVVRSYTITYYDSDGVTVLKTESLAYGSVPSYEPTKEGSAFDGWTPTPTAVTGNASYTAVWGAVIASGTYNNVNYVIYPNGTMRISGSGEMADGISYTSYPWYRHRNKVTNLVIEEGVTKVGALAFYNQPIVSLTLPNSLNTIGNGAFDSCINLHTLVIPDGVTKIPQTAFGYCTALSSIDFGSGVTELGWHAFIGCTALANITIPNNIVVMYGAFSSCSGLENVVFENNNGWSIGSSATATSWTPVNVTDPAAAATLLKDTYKSKYWKRT